MDKILRQYDSLSLAALKKRSNFLKRKETKYLIHQKKLPDVLKLFLDDYDLLEIDGVSVFTYDSCYFDTDHLRSHHQHHQGKRHRAKMRTRAYVNDPDLTYFEVKLKKGTKTFKYRLPVARHNHGKLTDTMFNFLSEKYQQQYNKPFAQKISNSLRIQYQRITLVHKQNHERVTIDFAINFYGKTGSHPLTNAIIIESKSDMNHSPSKYLLKTLGIRTIGTCSKYCLASIMLYKSKHNRFKQLIKYTNRIKKSPA